MNRRTFFRLAAGALALIPGPIKTGVESLTHIPISDWEEELRYATLKHVTPTLVDNIFRTDSLTSYLESRSLTSEHRTPPGTPIVAPLEYRKR